MRIAGIGFAISTVAISQSGWLDTGLPVNSAHAAQFTAAGTGRTTQSRDDLVRLAEAAKKGGKKKGEGNENRASYTNIPLADRVGMQFELAWTGHFNGLINGEFNDKSVAAIKAFQKDFHLKETGTLAASDRNLLASMAKAKQEQVGWRMMDDTATGAQVGVPTKQVPNTTRGRTGTRWSSAQGQVQVETFRLREPGLTLTAVFEQQKKEPPNRKLEVNFIRSDFFILSGWQGLKKFYVRAESRDFEVRGLTILYDQATEGIMDPVAVVMSSAFAPFPGTGLAALMGTAPRRKVEYGTGIIVNSAGYIATDRRLTENCNAVEVGGYGYANVVAQDDTAGIALLRLYGARALAPAVLVHEGIAGSDLTLVGIADPQLQAGRRAITTASAKLNGEAIQPFPQNGFDGAAALDSRGRFLGMVALKPGGEGGTSTQATLIGVDRLRRFLDAQYVTAATGADGIETAKAATVRVICARM